MFSDNLDEVARLVRLYTHIFIRLPRLIALLRELRERGPTPTVHWQATHAALVCADLTDSEAESYLLHHVGVRPTFNPETARVTATSLSFNDRISFHTATYYWSTRILTNRLCLKLLEVVELPRKTFDPERLVAENTRMATNILMSLEYAATAGYLAGLALRIALVALWSAIPYMKGSNTETTLRQFVRRCYSRLHHHHQLLSEAKLDEAADLLVGGPLKGFLVDFVLAAESLA